MIAVMVNAGNKKVSAPSTSKHRTPTTPPMTAGLCSFVSIHWLTTITVNNAVMEKSIPVVSRQDPSGQCTYTASQNPIAMIQQRNAEADPFLTHSLRNFQIT